MPSPACNKGCLLSVPNPAASQARKEARFARTLLSPLAAEAGCKGIVAGRRRRVSPGRSVPAPTPRRRRPGARIGEPIHVRQGEPVFGGPAYAGPQIHLSFTSRRLTASSFERSAAAWTCCLSFAPPPPARYGGCESSRGVAGRAAPTRRLAGPQVRSWSDCDSISDAS